MYIVTDDHCHKSKEFRVSFLKDFSNLDPMVINGQPLELVNCFKLLVVYLTANLSWNILVEFMYGKASKRLYILFILKLSGLKKFLKIYPVAMVSWLQP